MAKKTNGKEDLFKKIRVFKESYFLIGNPIPFRVLVGKIVSALKKDGITPQNLSGTIGIPTDFLEKTIDKKQMTSDSEFYQFLLANSTSLQKLMKTIGFDFNDWQIAPSQEQYDSADGVTGYCRPYGDSIPPYFQMKQKKQEKQLEEFLKALKKKKR